MEIQRAEKQGRFAAIYCRTATVEADRDALAEQEARCRAFAVSSGYVIAKANVFREVASGLDYVDRPQLVALRAAIQVGGVDAVIVTSLDRLGRDAARTEFLCRQIEDSGVVILTCVVNH